MTSNLAAFYTELMRESGITSQSLFDEDVAAVEMELYDAVPWIKELSAEKQNQLVKFAFQRRGAI